MIDARPFLAWIFDEYEPSVRVDRAAGHYTRQPGEAVVELYGVADMACVLHTIGRLRPSESVRREWDAAFAQVQNEDGWYLEATPTHDRLHSTAFAIRHGARRAPPSSTATNRGRARRPDHHRAVPR